MKTFFIKQSVCPIAGNVQQVFMLDDKNTEWAIPTDELNTHYQAYLAWVDEGNTAEEWQPESEGN
jgi:hypothetical protein